MVRDRCMRIACFSLALELGAAKVTLRGPPAKCEASEEMPASEHACRSAAGSLEKGFVPAFLHANHSRDGPRCGYDDRAGDTRIRWYADGTTSTEWTRALRWKAVCVLVAQPGGDAGSFTLRMLATITAVSLLCFLPSVVIVVMARAASQRNARVVPDIIPEQGCKEEPIQTTCRKTCTLATETPSEFDGASNHFDSWTQRRYVHAAQTEENGNLLVVRIDRSDGSPLGLSVSPDEEDAALEILDVVPGLVKDWCDQSLVGPVVRKGDKIVAVDDIWGPAWRLVELIRQEKFLVLSILLGCRSDLAPESQSGPGSPVSNEPLCTPRRSCHAQPPQGGSPVQPSESSSPGLGRSESRHSFCSTDVPSSPAGSSLEESSCSEVQAVETLLRSLLEEPFAERKRVIKALLLAYHPDKNDHFMAKEVFQYVNCARTWFLHEI
eukprot:TRINITY_DN102925_c0_g1_i1.p1 TRINITY_DN102925_c0_g1~~TRINITY_DN102925_c0_g1_i1.p1  ORF type:complete len:438 (-),score=51.88 TRINITY_DN102925_c0_g1_i1:139-1452(-)